MAEETHEAVHSEQTVTAVDPSRIVPNPNNPRRFFNERALDELRSSIQKVGVLVPLIVYEAPDKPGTFVLLDGERRLRCVNELGISQVPVNTIPAPTQLDNILRMFNIHAVREEWPLISVAMSLRDVMAHSGEDREAALAELTGLNRATVRRAKKLLDLPIDELERIRGEAHLSRNEQVHREDLYLEVTDAISAIERGMPAFAKQATRPKMIRKLVSKREKGSLVSVTDYRSIPKLIRAVEREQVDADDAQQVVEEVVNTVSLNPKDAVDRLAEQAFEAQDVLRKSESLLRTLEGLRVHKRQRELIAPVLQDLRREIDRLLG
jgi:ParB family transcriptional regulator, chromosome partitioning protein